MYLYFCVMIESKRQQKYNRLIQKELSEIFLRESRNLFGKAMVTVTVVRTTADLGLCKVYLSILLAEPQSILDNVAKHHGAIKKILGNKIRHQVRVVPELKYYVDNTAEEAEKMNKLISSLTKPKDKPED